MDSQTTERISERPTFSLRAMLLAMIGSAIYMVKAVPVLRHHERLLDVVADGAGPFAASCGLLGFVGFSLMILGILRSVTRTKSLQANVYRWPAIVMMAALLYAPLNGVAFLVTLLTDSSAIFSDHYVFGVVLVVPASSLVGIFFFACFFRKIDGLSLVGCAIWIETISLAHFWIIAAASSSV